MNYRKTFRLGNIKQSEILTDVIEIIPCNIFNPQKKLCERDSFQSNCIQIDEILKNVSWETYSVPKTAILQNTREQLILSLANKNWKGFQICVFDLVLNQKGFQINLLNTLFKSLLGFIWANWYWYYYDKDSL